MDIVIPCRNDSRYLERLLESIKAQTRTNHRTILVDDHSEDSMAIGGICERHDVQYIRSSRRLGAAEVRNAGFKHVQSEFTFFCDADVVLHPECLEAHVKNLRKNIQCSWSYSNFTVGKKVHRFYPFNPKSMYRQNCCSTMSLIRTSAMPKFHKCLQRFQDWDMFLTLIEEGHIGSWIDRDLFFAHDRQGITNASISTRQALEDLKKHHPKVVVV